MNSRLSIDDMRKRSYANPAALQMGASGVDITKLRGAPASTTPPPQSSALPANVSPQVTPTSTTQSGSVVSSVALPIRGLSFSISPGGGAMEVALPNVAITMPQANPQQFAQAAFDLFQRVYSNFPRLSGTIPFTNVRWRDLTDFLAYKHALRYASPVAAMGQFIDATYMPAKLAPAYMQTALEASALPYKLGELQARTEELKSRKINPELAGEYLQFLFSSFPNFSLSLDEGLF